MDSRSSIETITTLSSSSSMLTMIKAATASVLMSAQLLSLMPSVAVLGEAQAEGQATRKLGKLTFSHIADWGLGAWKTNHWEEITTAEAHIEVCRKLGCNFTISAGDNMYQSPPTGIENSFVHMYRNKLDIPFFPVPGNHDSTGPQIQFSKKDPLWKFPAPYYTFKMPIGDTGYTVQIYGVNTMEGMRHGRQREWLDRELNQSDARWHIIFGHYPYTGGGWHKKESGGKGMEDVFAKNPKAQIYLTGHDHIQDLAADRCFGIHHINGNLGRGGVAHWMNRPPGVTPHLTLLQLPPWSDNKYMQYPHLAQRTLPYPEFGFTTLELTPNVVTLKLWDRWGTQHWSYSSTWDARQKAKQRGECEVFHGEAWSKKTPSERVLPLTPKMIRDSMIEERMLPKGPGGGTSFAYGTGLARHDIVNTDYQADWVTKQEKETEQKIKEQAKQEPATPDTPAPQQNVIAELDTQKKSMDSAIEQLQKNAATAAGKSATTTVEQEASGAKTANRAELITFDVSAECDGCGGRPMVDEPFTLHINGDNMDADTKIFLTQSARGCVTGDSPSSSTSAGSTFPLGAGSTPRSLTAGGAMNIITYTLNVGGSMYVCVNVGKTSTGADIFAPIHSSVDPNKNFFYVATEKADVISAHHFSDDDIDLIEGGGDVESDSASSSLKKKNSRSSKLLQRPGLSKGGANDSGSIHHLSLMIGILFGMLGGVVGGIYYGRQTSNNSKKKQPAKTGQRRALTSTENQDEDDDDAHVVVQQNEA